MHLFLFLISAIQICFADQLSYTLTLRNNSWDFGEQLGTNPDLFVSPGDTLTFQVSGLNNIIFAIYKGTTDSAGTDRFLTTPVELSVDGSLSFLISSDLSGMVMWYMGVCDRNDTCAHLQGRIFIFPSNCIKIDPTCGCIQCSDGYYLPGMGSECLRCSCCAMGEFISSPCAVFQDTICKPCTPCKDNEYLVSPCSGRGTEDRTICMPKDGSQVPMPNPSPCPLPDYCLKADCWQSGAEMKVMCTACADGYYITSEGRCSQCRRCAVGEFMSATCSGYTNAVCSPCTPCGRHQITVTPCPGTGSSDATVCKDEDVQCPLPDKCLTAQCWQSDTELEVMCTACADGYYITSEGRCSQCRICSSEEFVSYPCGGYTNTACSTGVSPCAPGYELRADGSCRPMWCLLRGCGARNVGILCQEVNDTAFSCQCPDKSPVIVNLPNHFSGCSLVPTPTEVEIVAHINALHLEAFLVNGILEVRSVFFLEVNGNSFMVHINATVPVRIFVDALKKQIALFLGGDFSDSDITITFDTSSKRYDTSPVRVTVGGDVSSASILRFPFYLFGLLFLALRYF